MPATPRSKADERELRKRALMHAFAKAPNVQTAIRNAKAMVRYVESGEVEPPNTREVMPGS